MRWLCKHLVVDEIVIIFGRLSDGIWERFFFCFVFRFVGNMFLMDNLSDFECMLLYMDECALLSVQLEMMLVCLAN